VSLWFNFAFNNATPTLDVKSKIKLLELVFQRKRWQYL